MKLVIGLTGVKQAGKTTTFNFLKERFPQVVEVALANKLKNVCSTAFGLKREAFDDPALKEVELDELVTLTEENLTHVLEGFGLPYTFDKHIRPHIGATLETARRVAQYIGTEVLRQVDPDVHCKSAVLDVPESAIAVVTDMRFHNEFDFFSTAYGTSFFPFYIHNPGAEAKAALDSHASERYILEIAKKCEKIDNTGSLESLRDSVVRKIGAALDAAKVEKLAG